MKKVFLSLRAKSQKQQSKQHLVIGVFGVGVLSKATILIVSCVLLSACSKQPQRSVNDVFKAYDESTDQLRAKRVKPIPIAANGHATSKKLLKKKVTYKKQPLIVVHEQEAKLADIPVPLGATLLQVDCQQSSYPSGIFLRYSVPAEASSILAFYEQELEHFGWQKAALMQGQEIVLIANKPNSLCVISLRQLVHKKGKPGSGCELVIATGKKEPGSA